MGTRVLIAFLPLLICSSAFAQGNVNARIASEIRKRFGGEINVGAAADGQVLSFNAATGTWVPANNGAFTGGSITTDLDMADAAKVTWGDLDIERVSEGVLRVDNGADGTTADGTLYLVSADEADGVFLSANGTAGRLEIGSTAGDDNGVVILEDVWARDSVGDTKVLIDCSAKELLLSSDTELKFHSAINNFSGTDDVGLARVSEGVLRLDNSDGTTANAEVRVYDSDESNYAFITHGGSSAQFGGDGTIALALAGNDATVTGALLATNVALGGPGVADTQLFRVSEAVAKLTNGTGTTAHAEVQLFDDDEGEYSGWETTGNGAHQWTDNGVSIFTADSTMLQTTAGVDVWIRDDGILVHGTGRDYQQTGEVTTITDNVATTIFSLTSADGDMAGLTIHYTIRCTDGTEYQSESGQVVVAIVDDAGGVVADVNETAATAQAVSSGTIDSVWTVVTTDDQSLEVQLQSNTSLTPTTMEVDWHVLYNGDVLVTVP